MTPQKTLPWFRFYSEAIDDEKLGLLAFEDRWHFVALLCLKCKGVLDGEQDHEMLRRKVALKMGLTCAELENVLRRLSKMGLIDFDTIQPMAWASRQMQSDSSTARVQAYREKKKQPRNVSETAQEVDLDLDKEEDKDKDLKAEPKSKDIPPSAKPAATVFTPLAALLEHGVPEQAAKDHLIVRKKKKQELTESALNGMKREAEKAGLSLADAVVIAAENSWGSFRAEWVNKPHQQGHGVGGTLMEHNLAAAAEAMRILRLNGDAHD